MKRSRRRKCPYCGRLFRPDARNLWHQRHCPKPSCRKVSKAASQRRWLAKSENRDYFRGAINVARVRVWRAAHPGYWRRPGAQPSPHSLRSGSGTGSRIRARRRFTSSRCSPGAYLGDNELAALVRRVYAE